jgi:hypothetical protein
MDFDFDLINKRIKEFQSDPLVKEVLEQVTTSLSRG